MFSFKRMSSFVLSVSLLVVNVFAQPSIVAVVENDYEKNYETMEMPVVGNVFVEDEVVNNNIFFKFSNKDKYSITSSFVKGSAIENGVWSFTGINNDPRITIPTEFFADDYKSISVRMKWNAEERADGVKPFAQLFYAGEDSEGNIVSINAAYSLKVTTELSSGDKYKVVTFPLTNANLKGMKIKTLYLDPIAANGDVTLDYLMINANDESSAFQWDFESGWGTLSPNSTNLIKIKDGCACFDEQYTANQILINDVSLEIDDWAGLEIVMRHKLKVNSAVSKLYFKGIGSDGTPYNFNETQKLQHAYTISDSFDGSEYYFYDFSKCAPIKGSTVTNIRFDPIKADASYAIDYMRLVPKIKISRTPLDKSLMKLEYAFEDNVNGNADGVITVDFGGQHTDNAKKIVLKWASENEGDGYSELVGYTYLKSLEGAHAQKGYVIDKDLLIPSSATALIAEITDCEKTFVLTYKIPAEKRKIDKGQPLYTVGFISDIHTGGWGSELSPNNRLVAAQQQLSEYTDFVVAVGDLTQWYGAYSGEEFKAYNYDGTKYTNNGETSPEYLGIGNSQWTVLENYLKSFSVPVYVVQGNHDIRDKDSWSPMIESEKYWRPFFENWVDYSNTANNQQKYKSVCSIDEKLNYYDTEINGHHYIFLTIPKVQAPYYYFGEEQFRWLDQKLYEMEESGKPIFVFGHVPVNYLWDGPVHDNVEFMELLSKHPTAIYVSGHSHHSLDVDFVTSHNGSQTQPSYVHDGGTTTINVPNDENLGYILKANSTEIEGSHGVILKVYEDCAEVWSRDFMADKWISRGYTKLAFKENCNIKDFSVNKTVRENDVVLKAQNTENTSITWILNGNESDVTTDTIIVDKDYTGFVAVRLTNEKGDYRSVSFENIFDIPDAEIVIPDGNVSMRVGNVEKSTGIRFVSNISFENRAKALEYGYIVTTKTLLDANGNELTFDLKSADGRALYVSGKNHVKNADGSIAFDKVFESTTDGVKFAGVMTGININDPYQVCEIMVARPYAKVLLDGKETYVYGREERCSLQEIANSLRENEEEFYLDNKALIDKLCDMKIK